MQKYDEKPEKLKEQIVYYSIQGVPKSKPVSNYQNIVFNRIKVCQ